MYLYIIQIRYLCRGTLAYRPVDMYIGTDTEIYCSVYPVSDANTNDDRKTCNNILHSFSSQLGENNN